MRLLNRENYIDNPEPYVTEDETTGLITITEPNHDWIKHRLETGEEVWVWSGE